MNVGLPCGHEYGSSVAKSWSMSARISSSVSLSPALMAALHANVLAMLSTRSRTSGLPDGSSVRMSCRILSCGHLGNAPGTASSRTVLPLMDLMVKPSWSSSGLTSSNDSHSPGDSSTATGKSSCWLGPASAAPDRDTRAFS